MNRTKKELYEENKQLKKYLKFWVGSDDEEDDIDIKRIIELSIKQKRKLILIKKILISMTIIILCIICFVVGLGWD